MVLHQYMSVWRSPFSLLLAKSFGPNIFWLQQFKIVGGGATIGTSVGATFGASVGPTVGPTNERKQGYITPRLRYLIKGTIFSGVGKGKGKGIGL